ncbi:hypothetical protein, partial [Methanobacterium sp.]|uniref:hypothetical protein n=1 Tax=Methanobacterium sp. TaxID=2164 RepID=UPI003C795979
HIFITNPPSRDILEDYIDDPDIMERFIIDGPYSDLSPVYGMADFLIDTIPEGGGVVKLEAMACSLPIVAFYNEKSPLFADNANLPPEYRYIGSTKDEILNYSHELIKNPQLRKKTGEYLYNYYLREFSPAKIYEDLVNIIKDTHNPSIREYQNVNGSDYDADYIRIWYNDVNFESYKRLLLQSLLKDSSFSFTERRNFYVQSLKNNEFKSKKLALMYAILSIIGWRGYSMIDKYLDAPIG